jgi:transmembrane sensor
MTPASVNEAPDPLIEEASIWHVRLREPDADDHDREAFQRWLERDPLHREAYAEMQRLWSALDVPVDKVLKAREISRPDVLPAMPPMPGRLSRRAVLRWGTVAAGIALTVSAGGWWHWGGRDDLRSDYVAGVGERAITTLPDGSEVTLNTDTALAVAMTERRRTVRMYRGEAYFTVARDAARPLVVETEAVEVRVVGTEFNVRIDDDRTTVSVLRGHVEVASSVPRRRPDAVSLKRGQQVIVDAGNVGPVQVFDAAAVTAWHRGQMVFYRTPLGAVVEELNRYHRGRILVINGELRRLNVTGVFDTKHPLSALDVIERILGVESTRITDRLVLVH